MSPLFICLGMSVRTIIACTLVYFLFVSVEPHTFSVSHTVVNPFVSESVAAIQLSSDRDLPLQLIIPSIGVQAKIQHVGLAPTGTGEMAAPSNLTDVAWFKDGTIPGANGSAVIAGHLNGRNVPQAVFYNLEKLVVGDVIFINGEHGTTLTFKVIGIKKYRYNDPTDDVFFSDNTTARLNLITCAGSWMPAIRLYDERTVIFSELVTTN